MLFVCYNELIQFKKKKKSSPKDSELINVMSANCVRAEGGMWIGQTARLQVKTV